DAGTRQVNVLSVRRSGASFRSDQQVLLTSADPWFRPVDVAAAPDGSVLVADWYDSAVGGHLFRDQTTGRIYRVAPKGAKLTNPKPAFASIPGLIAALRAPIVATQDTARRGLIERSRDEREAVDKALAELFQTGTPVERARALWVRHAIAGDSVAVAA